MYCSKCGAVLSEGVKFCGNCGNSVDTENVNNLMNIQDVSQSSSYNNTQMDYSNLNTNNMQMNTNILNNNVENKDNKGLYSLICGICSIVFVGFLGLPLGIVSIILRNKEQPKTSRGKIGKILGIIGIVLSTLYLIIFGLLVYFLVLGSSNLDIDHDYEYNIYEQDVFDAGITEDFTTLGYMDYVMPDCWKYDDTMSAQQQYKSYVFKYKDGKSMADIKAFSSLSPVTIDAVKDDIVGTGWVIDSETRETINGIEWYKMVTENYSLSGVNYHNIFYVAISKDNSSFYMFNFYVSNELNSNELTYFDDSVEYILDNVTLYKYDE